MLTLAGRGDTLDLTPPNGVILGPVSGLDDPPRALTEFTPDGWDGSIVEEARYRPRDVFIPMDLWAPDTVRLRALLRRVAGICEPKTPTYLTLTHGDGTVRRIEGRGSKPLSETMAGVEGGEWRRLGFSLYCPDPYFAGVQRSLTFRLGGGTERFLSSSAVDKFLPLRITESQVVGATTVVNAGDGEAWPRWEVTGPCGELSIGDDGAAWTLPLGLDEGETLVVDTRRGAQTVTVGGVNAWGRLSLGSVLWQLQPGVNRLSIVATDATAATSVTVTWAERWLTGW